MPGAGGGSGLDSGIDAGAPRDGGSSADAGTDAGALCSGACTADVCAEGQIQSCIPDGQQCGFLSSPATCGSGHCASPTACAVALAGEACDTDVFCASSYCRQRRCGWVQETVASLQHFSNASLVLDGGDDPLVLFETGPGGSSTLTLASRADGGWALEAVTAGWVTGAALALDRSGTPAFTSFTTDGLRLWRPRDGGWASQLVVPGAQTGDSALVFTSSGAPRVALFDGNTYTTRFAAPDGGGWSAQVVGSTGEKGIGLALDSSDRPHLCYGDEPHLRLMYATLGDAGWKNEVIDSIDGGRRSCSITVDGAGVPHVASYVVDPASRYEMSTSYATRTDAGWVHETIGAGFANDEMLKPIIRIDPQGRPVIAFQANDSVGCWLTLARRNATGSWSTYRIDWNCGSRPVVGAMELERDGTPVVIGVGYAIELFR